MAAPRRRPAARVHPSPAAGGGISSVVVVPYRIWPRRGAAQPQIPIERIGNRRGARDLLHTLRPAGIAVPRVDLAHFADFARPENLAGHARGVVGVTLVAHLRGHLVLLRSEERRVGK